jgi:hypothetical protein
LIQILVEAGHSWPSIKQYSFCEIGAFFRAAVLRQRDEGIRQLRLAWMGSNLSQKGLDQSIKDIESQYGKEKPSGPPVVEEWKRLAKFMSGMR